jgi:predicted metal-dependent peptidase
MGCSSTSAHSKDAERNGVLKLQLARAWVKKEFPWFYGTLIGLIPKYNPHIKTMGVTRGMVMYINYDWFQTLDVDIAGGCCIHEVQHVLRDLSRIAALDDPKTGGYAFDMPINDDLKKFGIKLPDFAVYSSSHDFPPGLSGEKYYELLKQNPPKNMKDGGVCSGSCVHDDGSQDPDDRTETEVQYFKKKGAADMRDFIKAKGFNAGNCPGSWQEFLNWEEEAPIVPWQRVVSVESRRVINKVVKGHSDYSLRHPAKRSYGIGMLRPGLITSHPTIAFIEDSSGSMSRDMIKDGRVEFCGAMKMLGITEVWFLNADVGVQTKPRLISINELKTLPVTGRGGTSFGPAIEAVSRLRPRPDITFYSTDGGGTDNDTIVKPRGMEFIWLLVPSSYTQRPCSWGKQILMSNDRDERKKFDMLK